MAESAGTPVIKVGYENFTPPVAPPGMYYHHDSGLLLPQGARLASRGQVIVCYLLAVLLFAVTLGVGYLLWALATWGSGQTPAQRLLHLRCWRPDAWRLAGRPRMALRQVINLLMDGELLAGVLIILRHRGAGRPGRGAAELGSGRRAGPGRLTEIPRPAQALSPVPVRNGGPAGLYRQSARCRRRR